MSNRIFLRNVRKINDLVFKEERDRKKLNNPDALNVEKIKSLIL